MKAIQTVLAAYRSTNAVITKEQITAAWAEFDSLRTLDAYVRLLIEMLGASDHRRLGEDCGEDACPLCWLEGQARELVDG